MGLSSRKSVEISSSTCADIDGTALGDSSTLMSLAWLVNIMVMIYASGDYIMGDI